eukprot:SAG31_NODE_12952_length_904_cov_3.627329_1_plen_46_part_10
MLEDSDLRQQLLTYYEEYGQVLATPPKTRAAKSNKSVKLAPTIEGL